MKHLDELTLLRMADGELPDDRKHTTRDHLLACARCQSSYEVLKAETEVLRAALREADEDLPDSVRPRVDLSWFLVAAAVLSFLGVTTFWNRVVEPAFEGLDDFGLDGASLATSVLIRSVLWRGWTDMVTTAFEVVAALVILLTAGTLVFWGWRRWRTATTLCFGLLVSLGVGERPAAAAVVELDRGTYVLRGDERIDNDLVVTAERVIIEGVLNGDLIVLTRYLEVTGEVRGDILGFAEEIDLTGAVGGSVRTGSRSLAIEGVVSRNVTAAGETIRLRPNGRVEGSFTSASREALLSGPVARDLIAAAETHELNGSLGGTALLVGERLRIGPEAAVEGEVKFYGAYEPDVSTQARLASGLTFEEIEHDERTSPAEWVTRTIYFWAAAFVLGAALILLAPGTSEALRTVHLPDYGKSFAVGLLSILVTGALALFLAVTLVGLPLGMLLFAVLAFGVYAAQAYVGVYIGSEILGVPADRSQALGRLALGLLVVHLGKAVPVLGTLVTIVVAVWGFGALTLWALDRAPWTGGTPPPAPVEARS